MCVSMQGLDVFTGANAVAAYSIGIVKATYRGIYLLIIEGVPFVTSYALGKTNYLFTSTKND